MKKIQYIVTETIDLMALASAQATGFVIACPSTSDRLYSVGWADLLINDFQIIASGIEFPVNSYTDALHNVESSGFYQIKASINP